MIRIRNWSSFQSYKDRKPPWIRLHKGLLDDYDFQSLSTQSKALLPMLWLLASEHKDPTSGIIECDAKRICFRLRIDQAQLDECIPELKNAGFIEVSDDCTEWLQSRNETVTPETETETETETEVYTPQTPLGNYIPQEVVMAFGEIQKAWVESNVPGFVDAREAKKQLLIDERWKVAEDIIASLPSWAKKYKADGYSHKLSTFLADELWKSAPKQDEETMEVTF